MSDTVIVEDKRGRKIEIRKLKFLEQFKLLELVGPENSMNKPYHGLAVLAHSVVSIDGNPIPRAKTKLDLEAIVQQLDDDGFVAVQEGVNANFAVTKESVEEEQAASKN